MALLSPDSLQHNRWYLDRDGGTIMRQITAAAIAIALMFAFNTVFETATPLGRIIFAAVSLCAAMGFVLWKDLPRSEPERPDA